nr:7652_t:CDS:2 [Entrophospora candida]CAG8691887.1 5036_t:CDS:2 [Entrophospora candida]
MDAEESIIKNNNDSDEIRNGSGSDCKTSSAPNDQWLKVLVQHVKIDDHRHALSENVKIDDIFKYKPLSPSLPESPLQPETLLCEEDTYIRHEESQI